ncbi:hypothetical protein [Pseudomonas amygdali]|uniref:hypothetical protein n=1 Tax=Pseudomonas amygdali TaxID=47877 RepID=UPI000C33100A|nr:hypothetical protein [Pseudomonas amygdali]PWD02100.1 hypothetical protein CX658_19300 [Pseudomonas amygdali pv. lachrymans]
MKPIKNALLCVASFFRPKTSTREACVETHCVPEKQELEVAFRYAHARLPIVQTKLENLGDDASVLKGRKIARVETGEVSICLHFEDESTLTISIPRK